jgi:pimeloyl-ACP methyl ester carboxylesterase
LVHGGFSGAWIWLPLMDSLRAAGHLVEAFDLPGMGDDHTSASEVSLDSYAGRVCGGAGGQFRTGRASVLSRAETASKNSQCEKSGWPEPVRVEAAKGYAPSRGVVAGSIGLLAVVSALNFIAAKVGLRYLPPLTMASFRVMLAGAVMVPTYIFCSRLSAFAEAREARRRGFSWGDVWAFVYLGFFGVAINQMCFTIGLHYTSVGHAAVIVGMGPIYTLLLAALFRLERVTFSHVVP